MKKVQVINLNGKKKQISEHAYLQRICAVSQTLDDVNRRLKKDGVSIDPHTVQDFFLFQWQVKYQNGRISLRTLSEIVSTLKEKPTKKLKVRYIEWEEFVEWQRVGTIVYSLKELGVSVETSKTAARFAPAKLSIEKIGKFPTLKCTAAQDTFSDNEVRFHNLLSILTPKSRSKMEKQWPINTVLHELENLIRTGNTRIPKIFTINMLSHPKKPLSIHVALQRKVSRCYNKQRELIDVSPLSNANIYPGNVIQNLQYWTHVKDPSQLTTVRRWAVEWGKKHNRNVIDVLMCIHIVLFTIEEALATGRVIHIPSFCKLWVGQRHSMPQMMIRKL